MAGVLTPPPSVNNLWGLCGATRPARIAMIGDSRTANGALVTGSIIGAAGRGILNRARAKLQGRIRHDPRFYSSSDYSGQSGDMYAYTGYTTTGIIAAGYHTAVVATHQANNGADPYSACVVLAGINDRADSNLFSYSTTIANYLTIRNTLVNAGIPVIWLDELPYSTTASGRTNATQAKIHMQTREWLQSRNGLPMEMTVGVFDALCDQTTSGMALPTANSPDNVHPNFVGADLAGARLAAALDQIVPKGKLYLPSCPGDQYDATNLPFGCLNTNPCNTGTGGTVGGTGISGTLPDTYTSSGGGTGLTVTLSKYTHTDGTVWIKCVGSGTPAANGSISITAATISSSLYAVGDVIDVMGEVMVDPSQTGLTAAFLNMFDGGASGGARNRQDQAYIAFGDAYPSYTVQTRETQRIPRYAIFAAGGQIPKYTIYYIGSVANSWTVYFRGMAVKKNLPWNF